MGYDFVHIFLQILIRIWFTMVVVVLKWIFTISMHVRNLRNWINTCESSKNQISSQWAYHSPGNRSHKQTTSNVKGLWKTKCELCAQYTKPNRFIDVSRMCNVIKMLLWHNPRLMNECKRFSKKNDCPLSALFHFFPNISQYFASQMNVLEASMQICRSMNIDWLLLVCDNWSNGSKHLFEQRKWSKLL